MITVKSQLLISLKKDFEAIDAIKSVRLNPVTLPRPDINTPWPITCLVDEPDTVVHKGSMVEKVFLLWTETWIWADDEADMTGLQDDILGQIELTMANPNSLYRQQAVRWEEKSAERYFQSVNECAILNKYEVYYRHELGNPYSQNIQRS
jgi:hypothetical protein